MDLIKISNETDTYSLEMKGTNAISLNTIDTYFSRAKGLTYMKDDIKCVVKLLKNDMLQLAPKITKYTLFYGNKASKRKFDDKIMSIIERNKAKSLKKNKFLEPKTPVPAMKEVLVGWKNLENGKYFLKSTEGTKRVLLDCNKEYSYDEVVDLCATSMKDGFNDKYFDRSVAVPQLGNYDSSTFTSFSDENNQSCDFWNFISKIKKGNHQYRLYLLSKPKKCVNTSIEKDKESSSNTSSAKNHRNESNTVGNELENNTLCNEKKQIVTDDINKLIKSKISDKKSKRILFATENQISSTSNNSNLLVNSKATSCGDAHGKVWMDQDFAPLKDMNCNVDLVDKDEIRFISGALIRQGGFGIVMKATWRHN